MRVRVLAVAACVTALVALWAAPASAHALVSSAEPERGSVVETAPALVSILFSEEPELSLSQIDVLDATGRSVATGQTEQDASERKILRRPIGDLADGVYTVSWRALSVVDGHVTAGAYAFGVGVDPSEVEAAGVATEDAGPSPSPLEVTARWLLFAGLGLLIGAAWIGVAAFAAVPAGTWGLMFAGWGTAAAGVLALAEAQRRAAGAGLGAFLSTAIGRALIMRAAAILAAGFLLVLARTMRGAGRRASLSLAGVAAAVAVWFHVSAGHAGASDPWLPAVVGQWVHVVAVGVWLGGLAALLAGVRGIPGEEKARAVRRFSAVAGVALFVVAATGVARSVQELASLSDLWASSYGLVVMIKVALIVVLGLMGLRNRRRNVPVAATDLSGLRRVSRAELVTAVAVLAAAALLASLTPPPAVSAVERLTSDPIVATGQDFGRRAQVELRISPGFPGPNDFRATISEPRSGAPVQAESVRLIFTYVEDAAVTSELVLAADGDGVWTASGADMALPGRWRISVLIQQATGGIEVPLQAATKCRAEATPVEGGPTLYDIPVGSGTVQGYTDPAERGFNEIHFTFFAADGSEAQIDDEPEMFATPPEGDRRPMTVRRFSTGHFVGDAQLTPGVWRFDIRATSTQGDALVACFNDEIEG